jgi:hypothetical protein
VGYAHSRLHELPSTHRRQAAAAATAPPVGWAIERWCFLAATPSNPGYAGGVRDLAQTIQALYDSQINVTITMLWGAGIDFALCSSLEMCDSGRIWHKVERADQLADALHEAALHSYPKSVYADGPGTLDGENHH